MKQNSVPKTLAFASVIAGLVVMGPMARADREATPLVSLISRSNRVVIGVVNSVAAGATVGAQTAAITVEKDLVGTGAKSIALRGSTRNEEQPRFSAGMRFVAFLSNGTSSSQPNVVDGEMGVIPVNV